MVPFLSCPLLPAKPAGVFVYFLPSMLGCAALLCEVLLSAALVPLWPATAALLLPHLHVNQTLLKIAKGSPALAHDGDPKTQGS
jgi:hypothetical protein